MLSINLRVKVSEDVHKDDLNSVPRHMKIACKHVFAWLFGRKDAADFDTAERYKFATVSCWSKGKIDHGLLENLLIMPLMYIRVLQRPVQGASW